MRKKGAVSTIDDDNCRSPEVIVDFECENDLLFIVIANIGLSSAYRTSIKFDREIVDSSGRNIASMKIFRMLEFAPPGKKIRIFVDRFSSYVARKQPQLITADISYSDKRGQKFNDTIRHNLTVYSDIAEVRML